MEVLFIDKENFGEIVGLKVKDIEINFRYIIFGLIKRYFGQRCLVKKIKINNNKRIYYFRGQKR